MAAGFLAVSDYLSYVHGNESDRVKSLTAVGMLALCTVLLLRRSSDNRVVVYFLWAVTLTSMIVVVLAGLAHFDANNFQASTATRHPTASPLFYHALPPNPSQASLAHSTPYHPTPEALFIHTTSPSSSPKTHSEIPTMALAVHSSLSQLPLASVSTTLLATTMSARLYSLYLPHCHTAKLNIRTSLTEHTLPTHSHCSQHLQHPQ